MDQPKEFTHFTADGRPVMVDVTGKEQTKRTAVAEGYVQMKTETQRAIMEQEFSKGDVLAVAQLAGIMAAKRTSELIPLCHQVPLHHVSVQLVFVEVDEEGQGVARGALGWDEHRALLRIESRVETTYQTGVEMEALTACSVAALTVYDMCKSVDKEMTIDQVRLIYKEGGKSGVFQAISTMGKNLGNSK